MPYNATIKPFREGKLYNLECRVIRPDGSVRFVQSMGEPIRDALQDLDNCTALCRDNGEDQTLEAAERAHILAILKETRWVLGGARGAAVRLGMNRSTLQFRLKKLGIVRPDICASLD